MASSLVAEAPPAEDLAALRAETRTAEADYSKARNRMSSKARAFVRLYVAGGQEDANKAAKEAGYSDGRVGWGMARRYAHEVERERLLQESRGILTLGEAQAIASSIARAPGVAPKDRVAALTLAARLQGAMSDRTDARDRRELAGDVDELIGRLRAVNARARAPRGRP